jgi:hypothetical protein
VTNTVQNGVPVTELYTAAMDAKGTGWDDQGLVLLTWTWSSINLQLPAVPRELLAIDPDGDGLFDLASVPSGSGPITFYGYASGNLVARGSTARAVEAQSKVCVGDFDADRRMEIAWTLDPSQTDLGRSTVVLVEKRNAGGQWSAHWPDPTRTDGGSAAGTNKTDKLLATKSCWRFRTILNSGGVQMAHYFPEQDPGGRSGRSGASASSTGVTRPLHTFPTLISARAMRAMSWGRRSASPRGSSPWPWASWETLTAMDLTSWRSSWLPFRVINLVAMISGQSIAGRRTVGYGHWASLQRTTLPPWVIFLEIRLSSRRRLRPM